MLRLVASAALGLVLNFSFSFFGPEFLLVPLTRRGRLKRPFRKAKTRPAPTMNNRPHL